MLVCHTPITKTTFMTPSVSFKVLPPAKSEVDGIAEVRAFVPRDVEGLLGGKSWVNYAEGYPGGEEPHSGGMKYIITASLASEYMGYVVFEERGDKLLVILFCLLKGDSIVYGGRFLFDGLREYARIQKAGSIEMDPNAEVVDAMEKMGFVEQGGLLVLQMRGKKATCSDYCVIA